MANRRRDGDEQLDFVAEFETRGSSGLSRRVVLAGGAAATGALATPSIAATQKVYASWQSLRDNYRTPDWYRDCKFGIWSHWGPQSVPEQGDWYGRFLYMQGHPMYAHHLARYGHPADTGMMDILHRWTAERWQPEALMKKFVAAGARYFVSLASHHDNLDCYASRHHPWNSLRVGPRRDVVGIWARAARRAGLKFGVSNHASHSWHWYQPAYGYDPEGPRRGQRYDAFRLRKSDGRGRWWEGLDPQQLYTGPSMVAPDGLATIKAMNDWHDAHDGQWTEEAPPYGPFARQWLLRQKDLVERYRPDFLYFDNYELPFGSIGLVAAAHYLNQAAARGQPVVMTAKKPTARSEGAFTEDVERGFSDRLRAVPWQTDTCLGDWFYNRGRFTDKSYKSARDVIQRLADVVAKNGNLLLSVPQRGDGTIDSEEDAILDGIGGWLRVNGEAIYASRPWRQFGEGPTSLTAGMQNEGAFKGFAAGDIRFTTRGGSLYALVLVPEPNGGRITVNSLPTGRASVAAVRMVGGGPLPFRQDDGGLHVTLPAGLGIVPVLKIDGELEHEVAGIFGSGDGGGGETRRRASRYRHRPRRPPRPRLRPAHLRAIRRASRHRHLRRHLGGQGQRHSERRRLSQGRHCRPQGTKGPIRAVARRMLRRRISLA
ncbi:alpha-L-fucosidase [Sphingomonas rhizophila]|uniref:alpha-L-fucosidase n=1 Tax=Sphingomonas rhizophila TaxID=2071607 RepID=A0A7G9SBB2_9SPHN|nr:alpha-L-fucosidase [Sphingomonas rhizophila]